MMAFLCKINVKTKFRHTKTKRVNWTPCIIKLYNAVSVEPVSKPTCQLYWSQATCHPNSKQIDINIYLLDILAEELWISSYSSHRRCNKNIALVIGK